MPSKIIDEVGLATHIKNVLESVVAKPSIECPRKKIAVEIEIKMADDQISGVTVKIVDSSTCWRTIIALITIKSNKAVELSVPNKSKYPFRSCLLEILSNIQIPGTCQHLQVTCPDG